MELAGHVARMERREKPTGFGGETWRKVKLGINRRRWEDNIKMDFKKLNVGMDSIDRLRNGTGGGVLWMRQRTFGLRRMWWISWLAENRLVSQEGLCSVELVKCNPRHYGTASIEVKDIRVWVVLRLDDPWRFHSRNANVQNQSKLCRPQNAINGLVCFVAGTAVTEKGLQWGRAERWVVYLYFIVSSRQ